MPKASGAASGYVAVVGENLDTIDGLQSYLGGAGLTARVSRALRDVLTVGAAARAVVVFPDEFGVADVVTHITSLRAARPRLLILFVTGAPQRFGSALTPDGRSLPPVVLPKPTFGWTILDAIRAHAKSESP